jgi:hypothetical protein
MQDNFHRPDDHEAKMARADLFKCAQYSFKLFKMIQEDQELEGWVQAKITKAADYIASVYHYMEYEMKISEYGSAIENSDMYSESIRRAFAQKLTEAKVQAKKAKAKMEKKEEELDEERSSTGGEITKTKTGLRHTHNPDRFSDEPHAEPASKAKSKSAAEKAGDKAHDKAQEKDSRAWGKANPGKQTIMKGGVKTTNEATKAKKDYDGDGKIESGKDEYLGSKIAAAKKAGKLKEGTCSVCKKTPCACDVKESVGKCNHTPKGEKCPVHGLKECGGMYEAAPRGQRSQDSAMKIHQIGKSKSPGANLKQGAEDALEKGNHKKIDQIHQYATTTTPTGRAKKVSEGDKFDPLKHVKNPTQGEKDAAKDVKRGSYADRAAMLKSAEADGRLKKESTGDYSAKKAAAGKDIGKPGKNFAKIEKSAGGGEKGKKIAGAVLAKLRAKG